MKAQASSEYLLAISFAIVAIMVAVGALSYFGVFSSNKALPSKCFFSGGIYWMANCEWVFRISLVSSAQNITKTNKKGEIVWAAFNSWYKQFETWNC